MADSLVAAKQEYTQQLCDLLCPSLFEGFKSIWKTCKVSDSTKNLKSFQEKLISVPLWNQNIIDNEYLRICKKEDTKLLLDKLIEAVFLSNVKVLSTIRLGKIKPINITIPETKKFLHQCYIESARKLWQDPHLIDDRAKMLTYSEIKRNEKRMMLNLSESVEKTVSKLIPIQNILEVYLTEMSGSEKDEDEDISSNASEEDRLSQEQKDTQDEEENNPEDSLFMSEESSVALVDSENNVPDLEVSHGNTIEEASEAPKISVNIHSSSVDSSNSNESPGSSTNSNIDIPTRASHYNEEKETNQQESAFFSDSDEE